jgi:hypothetical protein
VKSTESIKEKLIGLGFSKGLLSNKVICDARKQHKEQTIGGGLLGLQTIPALFQSLSRHAGFCSSVDLQSNGVFKSAGFSFPYSRCVHKYGLRLYSHDGTHTQDEVSLC